jgi:transposase
MNLGATLINPTTFSIRPRRTQTRVRNHRERGRRLGRPNDPQTFGQIGPAAAIVARGKPGREKTVTIAVNLSEQAAAWSAQDALADRLYREGDFLFESVEGVY